MIVASIINLIVSTSPDLWGRTYDQEVGVFVVDTVTWAFFVFDYAVRLATCPHVLRFVFNVFNLFDLGVIIPYIVTRILESQGRDSAVQVLYVLKVLRIVRIFRFFRLGRYSGLLNAAHTAVVQSGDALLIWVILMMTSLVLDATLIFFAEQTGSTFNATSKQWIYTIAPVQGQVSPFQSIYNSFWWAITTLTYVGYGDDVPQTPLGRTVYVVAVLTAIVSYLVPISVFLSRVNKEVARYREVKTASQLREMSQGEVLIKVFQMTQELNVKMAEMRKTQKTLGILLYKLGKTAMHANNQQQQRAGDTQTELGMSAGAARMFAQTAFTPLRRGDDDDDLSVGGGGDDNDGL